MAQVTLARYPGPPLPSQADLNLDGISQLSAEDRDALMVSVTAWLESYFNDVRAQLMDVHRDLLSLQKRVAEQDVELERIQ